MAAPRILAVDYDLYEVAYLAGGPRRAVDVAVVTLVESGRVDVDRSTGQFSVVDGRHRHALEAAVLDAIGRGHSSIETVRWHVGNGEPLAALRLRLERDGLLRPSTAPPGRRHRAWQALALTGEGRRTLRHLRSLPPADRVAPGTSAMQVALGGLGAMADPALRVAVFQPPGPPRSRGAFGLPRDARAAATGDGGGWGGGWGGAGAAAAGTAVAVEGTVAAAELPTVPDRAMSGA